MQKVDDIFCISDCKVLGKVERRALEMKLLLAAIMEEVLIQLLEVCQVAWEGERELLNDKGIAPLCTQV